MNLDCYYKGELNYIKVKNDQKINWKTFILSYYCLWGFFLFPNSIYFCFYFSFCFFYLFVLFLLLWTLKSHNNIIIQRNHNYWFKSSLCAVVKTVFLISCSDHATVHNTVTYGHKMCFHCYLSNFFMASMHSHMVIIQLQFSK